MAGPGGPTRGRRAADPSPHLRPALQRTRRLRATGRRPDPSAARELNEARRPAEADRQARDHVAGVGAVLGVVLGVVEDPPDPLEPLVPPMFGQSALVPAWVRGAVVVPGVVVVPSDGATVLGEADGSGLAAETTATPPATSNSPEIAA